MEKGQCLRCKNLKAFTDISGSELKCMGKSSKGHMVSWQYGLPGEGERNEKRAREYIRNRKPEKWCPLRGGTNEHDHYVGNPVGASRGFIQLTVREDQKMGCNDIISLQKWWIGELRAITQKVISQEEKRQERAAAKAAKLMGEYQTYADIQDAYGMGMISDKMHDKLLDLLEDRNRARQSSKLYKDKIALLTELTDIAKQIIIDNGGEA